MILCKLLLKPIASDFAHPDETRRLPATEELDMSDKAGTRPEIDAELARNIATIKRGLDARVAEIKRDLAQWIDQTTFPPDYTPVSIALLELAFERKLAIDHDAADVFDLVQRTFQRVVRRRNESLQ
jgi:hypothetical protein